jgi:transcriptional regulator with XRE-family HTH domain
VTRPGVDILRETVRRAVAASSQRTVAAQVGVSYRTIGKFLAGSEPYARTLKKLQEWYVSTVLPRDGAVSPEAATAAVFIVLDDVPQPRRAEAVRELVRSLVRIHRDAGVPPPGWITELESARVDPSPRR